MSKLYPLLLILLTIVFSGCVAISSPDTVSSNVTGSNTTVVPGTTNQIKATVTAIPTPTPTLIVIGNENSTVYVDIIGSVFKPSELRIIKGTIVKWENRDEAQYIINGTNFVSPTLNRRENWSYTFNKVGTFEYNCPLHSWMKHGRIIVE